MQEELPNLKTNTKFHLEEIQMFTFGRCTQFHFYEIQSFIWKKYKFTFGRTKPESKSYMYLEWESTIYRQVKLQERNFLKSSLLRECSLCAQLAEWSLKDHSNQIFDLRKTLTMIMM